MSLVLALRCEGAGSEETWWYLLNVWIIDQRHSVFISKSGQKPEKLTMAFRFLLWREALGSTKQLSQIAFTVLWESGVGQD